MGWQRYKSATNSGYYKLENAFDQKMYILLSSIFYIPI